VFRHPDRPATLRDPEGFFRLSRLPPVNAVFRAILHRIALPATVLFPPAIACAQIAVQDGFESGSLGAGWDLSAGVVVTNGGGAAGTAWFARLATNSAATGRDFGARLDDATPDGVRDFHLDFFFRVQATVQRQFNLQVSDSAAAIGNGGATINLRFQTNAWTVFSGGAWRNLTNLAPAIVGQWHHLRVTGRNWGQAGASFDVQLSDAGGTTFTSVATNVNWFHNGNPTNNPARYFVFTTAFGSSAGFEVDEVSAVVTATLNTPETNAVLNISGTYPHLAVFSAEGEIGMGAVVPWADKLWFVTYPPHQPNGGADKLWTVDSNLTLLARPESVGGTHANRMIHRESQQLVIGPYFVNATGAVRVVSPAAMPGRLTASARHLSDPTNKVYFASMEEGLYEVDVNTLAVTTLRPDTQGGSSQIPGAHGKGLYSGQGRVLYANNGESGWSVGSDPGFNGPAGVLTENTGTDYATGWQTVERKNFTEITGPGGIYGNTNSSDPIWSLGWDKRSVLLKLLDAGAWRTFRLPKGSYTHDAFHGWYTEWPRIREITDGRMLMHMHGLFYDFPKTFSAANTAGIRPLCTHLKMPVDYCWWNGQLVMGRDDASTTGGNIWAGQSHSAPWFGQLGDLEQWGAPAGFGGPWKNDAVTAGTPSEPFLIAGFQRRVLHLMHGGAGAVNFALQTDADGTGAWTTFTNVTVPAGGYAWQMLPASLQAPWLRLVPDGNTPNVTAYLHLGNPAGAPTPELFAGLADATTNSPCSDGILRPRGGDARTLQFAANQLDAAGALTGTAYYEIGGAFQLRRTTNVIAEAALRTTYSQSNASFTLDAASVIYTEGGNRFRLPRNSAAYDSAFASGFPRGAREVVTERQLFNAHGTFYELPYSTSGGFRRVRPVATHNKHISDFASWRGLLVIAGVAASATNNGHVFRSDDGQAALWFGDVDDLWRMGTPAGTGGPWKNSAVTAGAPSDPYLMFGYERKVLELSHASAQPVTFIVEVDVAADNTWSEYARFIVQPGQTVKHIFPDGYSAHWVRLKTDAAATVSATFTYGPAAPRLAELSPLPDGNVRVTFSGAAGQGYTVRASSDVALPLVNWVTLANGTFGTNSVTLDDLDATNSVRRFYVISMP
jgi:hypothetical protein